MHHTDLDLSHLLTSQLTLTHQLDTLYIHAPDTLTPLEDQLHNLNAQYQKGHFCRLGVCNVSPSQLSQYLSIAQTNKYVQPTVYQGQYNLLCRIYETTLFPLLRQHSIKFNAFGPLAGGFLTGKLTFSSGPEDLVGTRLDPAGSNVLGRAARAWYDKPEFHDAVRKMSKAGEEHGLELGDVAVRWLLFHSLLGEGDGVIIGPSRMEQVEGYLEARRRGPLPGTLVETLDRVWEDIREVSEGIVKYYSPLLVAKNIYLTSANVV